MPNSTSAVVKKTATAVPTTLAQRVVVPGATSDRAGWGESAQSGARLKTTTAQGATGLRMGRLANEEENLNRLTSVAVNVPVRLKGDECPESNRLIGSLFWRRQSLRRHECTHLHLENDVEIGGESPVPITEEQPVRRIGDVPMKGLWIEVIGEVEAAHGQANRVSRIHPEVFGKS